MDELADFNACLHAPAGRLCWPPPAALVTSPATWRREETGTVAVGGSGRMRVRGFALGEKWSASEIDSALLEEA